MKDAIIIIILVKSLIVHILNCIVYLLVVSVKIYVRSKNINILFVVNCILHVCGVCCSIKLY